ncbi:MAG: carbohydrate kinase [Anaerolineaceae bacterium]|nr:carbohydrate kinase [Anaerolineaceae bacterium]
MARYLLGLDNGNTVCKAALFDLNGREIHATSRRIDTLHTRPGWTERDMDTVWQETATVIRDLIAGSGIRPDEIAGVGCTGHGNGLYLLDKTGQPLRNGIQSLDTRAASLLDEWIADDMPARAYPHIWQNFYAGQAPLLLAWLKRHEPDTYARIGTVLLCKDYINYCLTGERATDYSDMGTTALLRVPEKTWSPELLDLYGIAEIADALPRLAHSAEVTGTVTAQAAEATGLAVGTPVVAGMIDIDAGAIGVGVNRAGQACVIVGSWSINEVIADEPVVSRDLFLTAPFADPDRWLIVEASTAGAANLDWFVSQFCAEEQREADSRGLSVFDVCGERVNSIPITDSVPVFHPFLYGSNVQATARAGFYGLVGWHTRAHVLRALYEGVVFSHLTHIERLRQAGAQFNVVRLTGGGARSAVWSQMFADVLNVPVEVTDCFESGTRGAALAAGIGAGIYASYAEAGEQSVIIEHVYQPNAARHAIYQGRYDHYREIETAMRTPWRKLNQSEEKDRS